LSPSTRRKDRVLKFSKYADSGVASYWIVDPQAPSVSAYDLVGGAYRQVGEATGTEALELDRPFPVTVRPAGLLDL
ncbi:MAG: Uma2 family endonuclease, partial [Actinomycetota bacterium]